MDLLSDIGNQFIKDQGQSLSKIIISANVHNQQQIIRTQQSKKSNPQFMQKTKHAQQSRLKRLLFAQHLRDKDRKQRMQQIRIDMGIQQKTNRLLHQTKIDLQNLYSMMQLNKTNQMNAAHAIADWLLKQEGQVCLQNKKDVYIWGYVLATAAEYCVSVLRVVSKHVRVLVEAGGIDVAVGVTASILNIVHKCKSNNKSSIQIQKQTQQQLHNLSQYLLSRIPQLFPSSTHPTQTQLHFYTNILNLYPQLSPNLTIPSILSRIISPLSTSIDNPSTQLQILKIIIYLTYYENQYYTGIVEYIVNQFGLFDSLGFILEFCNRSVEGNICAVLVVVENLGKDGYVGAIVENGVFGILGAIIDQPEDMKTRSYVQACQTYLSLVQHLPESNKTIITQSNTIDRILTILNTHCEYHRQLVQSCMYAIANILNIGQKIKQQNQSTINPYILKLKYAGALTIFNKFQAFQQFVNKYGQQLGEE